MNATWTPFALRSDTGDSLADGGTSTPRAPSNDSLAQLGREAPVISVLMPTNKADKHFELAVSSVLQSVDVEFELVIVVDAVDLDPTAFGWANDSRVTWIRTPSRSGPGGTMRYGLEASRGEFIARMDADDLCHPERLTRQHDVLARNTDVVAVSSRSRRINEHGEPTGDINLPFGEDIRRELLLQNAVPHSSLMTRRSSLADVGGYPATTQMEDYLLLLRLAQRGKITQLPERLIDYRVHDGQMSLGAPPRGAHIDAVVRERRQLGKHLGVSWLEVEAKNAVWRLVQFLRYYGLRKPGHTR